VEGQHYATKVVSVNNTEWSAVVVPINANHFSLRPDTDVLFRTDVNDSTTEDKIASGTQEYSAFDWPFNTVNVGSRFRLGDVLGYAKTVGGTGKLVAKFLL